MYIRVVYVRDDPRVLIMLILKLVKQEIAILYG